MSNLPPMPEGEVKSCTGDRWNEVAVEYFTADQMRAYAEEAVRLEREACLEAVLWERLGDAPECAEDTAYNNAIDHAAAAIRARSQEGQG
jgi:hypothetical protein